MNGEDRLTRHLSYTFGDIDLRDQALTHRSARGDNNERLEFLGDAVLGFVIAEALYERFPEADEGQLTRLRAALVNRRSLARISRVIDLGSALKLGEGELRAGGWRRDSILANALEALLGAVYLDGGLHACREVVLRVFDEELGKASPQSIVKDPKTQLQEYLQGRREPLPEYVMLQVQGAPHEQTFLVECRVRQLEPVSAQGRSRRIAEQEAARLALETLHKQGGG